ncbi:MULTISPECIES: hypothetical protein [Paraburkholderia]|uniref:hypothetical protein n=1 Tax=Paraburkholderia TaxID=1822464 RepID=UPI00224FB8DC|nr:MULTISPECIES: hypothetical protein [Paraburkholderia]MCX4159291.1 hypothetical protein [Paraburkholderia aspalathi]MDN7168690.1 hypothetical protein [Paraburkholderia sp. SECH2]MDQ6397177.1 hypothetical protein [Paraburkholderia aspalathi]
MANLRFVRAIDDMRPYGTHRYDVYGPKVDRRLILFGYRALNAWLQLEFNPNVVAYCERPLRVPDLRPARMVDFWVRGRDGERFLIVLRGSELQSFAAQPPQFAAFDAWARKTGIKVCLIGAEEGAPVGVLQRNQATILHHVAADHTFVTDEIKQRALAACGEGATVGELESRLSPVDGTLVRSAAFMLVLDGSLRCPTLAREPLCRQTQLACS